MNRLMGGLLGVSIVLLSACGSGSGDSPVPVESESGSEVTEPNGNVTPIATLSLAEDSTGASVVADLPDGGKVDLWFPEYSAMDKLDVTVAALPAMTLPTGTVAGGVRLLPEGTLLRYPATLTLKVPGTLDPARTLGFAVHKGVVTYHPVQVRHETLGQAAFTRVDIPLQGFSDHGLVIDADPGVVADAITINTPPLDRLSAQLATVGNGSDASQLLTDFFNNEVKPKLDFTTQNPADQVGFESAMRMFVAWRDQFNIMVTLYPVVDDAGTAEDFTATLLKEAIVANMTYWNQQCETSLDPADGMRVVQTWLWAPVVNVDYMAGVRKSDLLAMLCIQMEILDASLDAILQAEQSRPLVLKTGLKIRNDSAHRFDPPGLVRVNAVQGGTVTTTADLTDNQGKATLTVIPGADTPGVATVINVSAKGSAGIVAHEIRVFRPIEGKQDKLLAGKHFTGTVKEFYLYGGSCAAIPTDGPCAGQSECRVGGTATHLGGRIIIAGDPFAYDVDYVDSGWEPPSGSPAPAPITTRYKGTGTFSTFGGNGFSITQDGATIYATDSIYTSHIAARGLGLSIHSETGNLTGQINYQCHRIELEMQPAPP